MAQTIKLKRSATQGNIPTTAQLDLGEVAINTYDGKMYLKKDDGTESVVEVGAGSGGGGISYARKTANYTASAGEGIIADTSGGTWTLTLPSSPSTGDQVVVVDGADWSSTNLTVARNGSTIEGDAEDMTMNIGGVSVDFIYDGTTWEIFVAAGASPSNVATLTGVETLSSKTLVDVILEGSIAEEVYALSGTTPSIDPDNGTIQTWTLSGNSTPTDGLASGEFVELYIDDGTGYTITWTSLVDFWLGGSAPTLATTGYSKVILQKVGANVYATYIGDYS